MKNKTKLIIWVIIAIVAVLLLGLMVYNIAVAKTSNIPNPVATFEVENYGTIKIELYPEYAPNTVSNFVNLIKNGFYNGKTFYGRDVNAIYATRNADGTDVEPTMSLVDSSIQAGDDNDTEYQIKGEFVANGYEENTLKHEAGVVSMLREEYSSYFGLTEQGYNSASCHFQIMLETNRNLNGVYTAFGKVIEGLDIVEEIFASDAKEVDESEETTTSTSSITEFAEPAVITEATVETYGVDYGVPEVEEAFDYDAFLQSYFNQYYNTSSAE
jgi:peptidyl-prolyl cis-trans isomerase B (cyclophilin B)